MSLTHTHTSKWPDRLRDHILHEVIDHAPTGTFKDVRFYPVMNFGHFWAPFTFDLPQCQEQWRWGRRRRARRNCQKRKETIHRGKPRQTERKQQHGERDKQHSVFLVNMLPAKGRRFHKNTACARQGVGSKVLHWPILLRPVLFRARSIWAWCHVGQIFVFFRFWPFSGVLLLLWCCCSVVVVLLLFIVVLFVAVLQCCSVAVLQCCSVAVCVVCCVLCVVCCVLCVVCCVLCVVCCVLCVVCCVLLPKHSTFKPLNLRLSTSTDLHVEHRRHSAAMLHMKAR